MTSFAVVAALAVATQVASPERQKELLAAINAENARPVVASPPGRVIGVEIPADGFVGPPRPIRDEPVVAKPNAASERPARLSTSAKDRLARKRAGYRAANSRFTSEQAAEAEAARAEFQRNLPLLLELQRQQNQIELRSYEANLRFRSDMDFNDALRGVTRPVR